MNLTKKRFFNPLFFAVACVVCACGNNGDTSEFGVFQLEIIEIEKEVNLPDYTDVNPELVVKLIFSEAVDSTTLQKNITLRKSEGSDVPLIYTTDNRIVHIKTEKELAPYTSYQLIVNTGLKSVAGRFVVTGKVYSIFTGFNPVDKFPRIPDEELLTLVQKQTFRYFWDFGHPVSGMARERTTSENTVTTGGTGFGVMAMIAAAERGFITKEEALQRIRKIVDFLATNCTRYHGAFAHWIHGQTGATIPFSAYDNGADLVETSFLFQGLLTARQYFSNSTSEETRLRQDITRLWEEIDWRWFQKDGENALYWHWSPRYEWQMNMKISGWNESLITYVLAASSPTHAIPQTAYHEGWARNGSMTNNASFFGYKLPLGPTLGGPLFFAHYSFLGINPKGLKDRYADYWEQNRHHTLINYNHCIDNPKKYAGYGEHCWGLTASDGNQGYSAHSPTNDRGVIAPTAALSSIPYTPEESMKALHFFYYKLGDKLWSDYGFADAFNLSEHWFDSQHIAIDQGPIIVMIENYRTGLLWNLFMSIPEIKVGLTKLGFTFSTP